MERENKKRGREEDREEEKRYCGEKSGKKRQESNIISFDEDEDETFKAWESLNMHPCSGGVFDFPWLKEGVISKSEEEEILKYEDAFSSSLDDTCAAATTVGAELIAGAPCMCQTAAPSSSEENYKLEDENNNMWAALEGEDGIWSSLLNQPLSMGFIERGV